MSNDPRIQQLIDRLPQLDEEERALKIESSACAYPVLTDSGKAEMVISDPARLGEIRQEMAAIGREREAINTKLDKLRELLGPEMYIGGTSSDEDHKQRLISELAIYFEHKVLRSNPRQYILPEVAILDPRYTTKRDEIMPMIEACEIRIKAAEERQAAAWAILNA